MVEKSEFLYSAISDAQELIRFVDTKTAVAITILASYVVAFFSVIEKVVKYHYYFSCCFWLSLVFFVISLVGCIVITSRIIRPTNNPKDIVIFSNLSEPKLRYFLGANTYRKKCLYPFVNSSKFKLKANFDTYFKQICSAKEEDIIHALTFELFKVSFIRNIKNDRFNFLVWMLLTTTISFLTSYLFLVIETHLITENLKELQNHYQGI
jgi:hypothetical protein